MQSNKREILRIKCKTKIDLNKIKINIALEDISETIQQYLMDFYLYYPRGIIRVPC